MANTFTETYPEAMRVLRRNAGTPRQREWLKASGEATIQACEDDTPFQLHVAAALLVGWLLSEGSGRPLGITQSVQKAAQVPSDHPDSLTAR
jgi:hypothetical protein